MDNGQGGFFYTLALNLMAAKKPKHAGSRARLQQTSNRQAMTERLRLQTLVSRDELCVCHTVREPEIKEVA